MTPIEMVPVDSSNVAAVGYDADQQEVYVEFLRSGTYIYSGVDQETYEALRDAASVGSYLNRVIKPSYNYRQL